MSDPAEMSAEDRAAIRAARRADRQRRPSYAVALTLAIAIATATNMFTFAVLLDALFSEGPGLSENATQVLTGWGGGIIGVIGAVVGYSAGHSQGSAESPREFES